MKIFLLLLATWGSTSLAVSSGYNSEDPNLVQFKPETVQETSGQFCLDCFKESINLDPYIFPQREVFVQDLKQFEQFISLPR